MIRKIFNLSIIVGFLSMVMLGSVIAKEPNIKMLLFYASWNANSSKAKSVTQEVAKTYEKRVGYKALDVDSLDTYKFIKQKNIYMPKYIPSIILIDKHAKIITTKEYRNESESILKNSLDSYILPKI